ncbi:MAG: SusC/RagA family TonB-linked outer membrane protein [Chitinophagaceae bacterium]|nr:SusC/RagA family TonB-linked outer membrane protein [Chitinophagaceae bacterium]
MRKLISNFLCCLLFYAAYSQKTEINGKVTDSTGNGLANVSIKERNSNNGTVSDLNGNFRLMTAPGTPLEISMVGYLPTVVNASNNLSITLLAGGSSLDEVIVTALGIRRDKRNLTYAAQEVKGETLQQARQENIVNALAGKVAGVQISNSSGQPGSSSRIVIRGITSLNGENQALFVIDGIPMDNTEAGVIDATNQGPDNAALNSGSTSNRAIDLDPNIIESVTVLKGAAATALYGSSAARGAIVITTKTGSRSRRPQVTLGTNYGFNTAILAEFQDKYAQGTNFEYVDGNNGQFASTSWGPLIDTLRVNGQPVKKHDPRKEFFRTGHVTDNNVSVSGSTDQSKYLISYAFLRNDGIVPNSLFQRHSLFGKFTNQITKNLSATIQLNYINTFNDRMAEGNGLTNPLWTIFAAPISWEPFPTTNPDGSQRLYRVARNNPYFLLDNVKTTSTVNRFLPIATLTYTPLSWLSVTERIGADIYTDQQHYHESNKIVGGLFVGNGGVSNRLQTFRQFNHDLMIEAKKNLTDKLYTSFLVGNNILSQYSQYYTQTAFGLSIDNYYNINNGAVSSVSDVYSLNRKVGFYAQLNAEYNKMFVLGLTGRYDGTSVLAQGNNYYPYGSAAVGFIFSELLNERFNALNFGKVRVSYSIVGNDNVSPYLLTTPFVPAGQVNNIAFPFNGQSGFLLSPTLGSENLKNETLKEFETGLELRMFNNRLSFDGSYFIRKTSDLLTLTPLAPSSGFFEAILNAGSLEDKGFELLLGATPVKSRNFGWDISINFTRIRNKVTELGEGIDKIQFGGFGGGGGTYAFKDMPYNMIFGSMYERDANGEIVVDDGGLPIIADQNGIIGNTNPDFNAGMSNTFTYKAFSLGFVFDWKQGGDIFSLDNHYNWFYGTPKATENREPFIVKGVKASDGKENDIFISAEDYYKGVSEIDEACIEDGTYIKLRSLSLSYNWNPQSGRLPFKNVSFTVSGNNLWIYKPHFTGSDPEQNIVGAGNGQGIVNYLIPTSRSVNLGLRVTF